MTRLQMPNPIELYEAVSQGFAEAIRGVRADQMSNATPCSGWNVQALLNHNIKVTRVFHGTLRAGPPVDDMAVAAPCRRKGRWPLLEPVPPGAGGGQVPPAISSGFRKPRRRCGAGEVGAV